MASDPEEPEYEVLREHDGFEVRRYLPIQARLLTSGKDGAVAPVDSGVSQAISSEETSPTRG